MRLAALLLTLISCSSFAGEIRMEGVYIQARETTSKKFVIEFCELGFCTPMGVKVEGHTINVYRKMRKLCERQRRINGLAASALRGLVIGGATLLSSGTAALVVGIGGLSAVDTIFPSMGNQKIATKAMMGLFAVEHFSLNFDMFYELRAGLRGCLAFYEKTPAAWLPDCDQDPNCKKKLAQDLFYTDAEVQTMSAYDLFFKRDNKVDYNILP